MSLQQAAMKYLAVGISVIPIDHRTKKPKGEWKEFQGRRAEAREVKAWFGESVKAMAAVCGSISGGLLVLDFDVAGFYEDWAREVGALAHGLPVQRTGGGGQQVFLRCPSPGGNLKLAWAPNAEAASGREVAIETRGEGGYVVIPPSLHPTGGTYRWLNVNGELVIPVVAQAVTDALLAAARKLCQAPFTRQEREEQEKRMAAARPRQRSGGAEVSVIDTFNANHDIETMLLSYGYTRRGKYLIRPGGKGSSVWITDNRSFHFSSNDPLSGSHLIDPFEAFCKMEHGGDAKKAVKAASALLGLQRSGGARNEPVNTDTSPGESTAAPAATPDQPQGAAVATATISAPMTPQEAGLTGTAFHYTDTGNALRMVRSYGHLVRYNSEPYGKWLWWNGRYWQFDRTNKIYEYVDRVISDIYREAADTEDTEWRKKLVKLGRDLEGMSAQRNLIKKAETIQSVNVGSDELDSHAWLINCGNVTLDLTGGEVKARQHRQEDYLTRALEADYDPEAKCPQWEQFLGEIFDGDEEILQFIQRAVGYSLTGDISEQCLFFAYGTGKNGKSVFFNALENLLGDYFYKAPADMILQQKNNQIPSDVAQMKGKRFVITSELDDNRRLAEARVKNLTGGDTIEARPMYKDWFTFRPTHKLWMFGNHKPGISGTDEGIWRRVKIIPFTVTIAEEKRRPMREMLDVFKSEASGILNWALDGYVRYCEAGFNEPQRMKAAATEYRTENDIVGQFIEENCEVIRELSVTAKGLWNAYHGWCDDLGEHAIPARRLNAKLRERGFEVRAGTGNKTMVYGLALKAVSGS